MIRPSAASALTIVRTISAVVTSRPETGSSRMTEPRVVEQCGREQDLLAHSLGKGCQRCVAIGVEAEDPQEPIDLLFESGRGNSAKAPAESEVFGCREVSVDVGFFRDVADLRLVRDQVVLNVLAVEVNRAERRRHQPGEHFHRGRLAGSVGAEVAEHLPRADGEADVPHGSDRAVALGDLAHLQHVAGLDTENRSIGQSLEFLLDALGVAALAAASPKSFQKDAMHRDSTGILPGTLDLLILKAVSLGQLHGYGVLLRVPQMTQGSLTVEQGALYPALYRLERQGLLDPEWGTSENNRRAKFYRLTADGRKRLKEQLDGWNRMVGIMGAALKTRASEV